MMGANGEHKLPRYRGAERDRKTSRGPPSVVSLLSSKKSDFGPPSIGTPVGWSADYSGPR